MRKTRNAVAAGVVLLTAVAVAGCSSTDGSTGGSADAPACEPSDGAVTLQFTSWIPGIEDIVAVWNEENPDIQVEVQTGPNGNSGTYTSFFNQLKAGNAPDLGQIEYDALSSFVVQDGLQDLSGCEDVVAAESDFIPWTWNQVTLGTDAVYAIPQDTGPMAMFYRKDLFEAAGIDVPTTWEEYAEAAVKVKEAGGYITNFSTSDINQFAGLVWQDGGSWFGNDGDNWTVDFTDDASTQVADYWQKLLDDDLVSTVPAWTTEWDNAYNTGAAWTWVSAVWGANSISSGAPDTAGDWAVAPAPQWEDGDDAAGNWGGSSTAVFSGTEHPYEAAKFALWLNTSEEALTMLNESANLYPATTDGLSLDSLSEGVDFYGGQKIYDVFAEAAQNVSADFTWGPTMTQTYADVSDGFQDAANGTGTLLDALTSAQASTIATLKSQSIPVAE